MVVLSIFAIAVVLPTESLVIVPTQQDARIVPPNVVPPNVMKVEKGSGVMTQEVGVERMMVIVVEMGVVIQVDAPPIVAGRDVAKMMVKSAVWVQPRMSGTITAEQDVARK